MGCAVRSGYGDKPVGDQMPFRACLLCLLTTSSALATPVQLSHQGRLLDAAGGPLNGAQSLTIALWESDAPGAAAMWSTTYEVDAQDGFYSVVLDVDDSNVALDSDWFAGPIWVSHQLAEGNATPRQPLLQVPSAAHATHAGDADRADQASSVAVATGLSGACSSAGEVAWDSDQAALRVCDGSA